MRAKMDKSMDVYSMSQVETLTGIKSTTLRAWERRYRFLTPMRSGTNIRYYSDTELRKLINISILREHGYRISKIDAMSAREIDDAVFDTISTKSGTSKEEVLALTNSMLSLDEAAFTKIFDVRARRDGLLSTMINLVYPFLTHVGLLWTTSKLVPAQEHFISNLIRQKIILSIDQLPIHKDGAPTIVMFLPENEMHEIGLMLAHFIAKERGWRVIYLGQRVPIDSLFAAVRIAKARFILTIAISTKPERIGQLLNQITSTCDSGVILSGPPNLEHVTTSSARTTYVGSPTELNSFLEQNKE